MTPFLILKKDFWKPTKYDIQFIQRTGRNAFGMYSKICQEQPRIERAKDDLFRAVVEQFKKESMELTIKV